MNLTEDFKEFIQLLNKNSAEYIVVGGYAVAAHGYPRYTGDIDFWVRPSYDNAVRIIKSLIEFGFGSIDISSDDLISKNRIIQLGFPPNRIDIITSIDGVDFEECLRDKKEVNIEGIPIPFLSLHHLKLNKIASGRTKDKLDLENLP
jgi:hypothetical protein